MKNVIIAFGWLITIAMGMAGLVMFAVADRATELGSFYVARGAGILLVALFFLLVLMLLMFANLHNAIRVNGCHSRQQPDDTTQPSAPVSQESTDNS